MKKIALILVLLILSQVALPMSVYQAYGMETGLEPIYINFQSTAASVPEGYIADYGELYGMRGGYTFGWNKDHAAGGVLWENQQDASLATGITMDSDSIWELQLYNGIYEVTLGVYAEEDKTIGLIVEDTSYWSHQPLAANEVLEKTYLIEVTDGRLTLKAETEDTIISYLYAVPNSVIIEAEEAGDTTEDSEGETGNTGETELADEDATEEAATEGEDDLQLPSVLLKMYNANRNPQNNTIFPWFQLVNSGDEAIDLKNITIRYYYTIDGELDQKHFSDWSNVGAGNITGKFVKMQQPWENANYYFEIGFAEGAGSLASGAIAEIQGRIAKVDWSDYVQTNDHSFNQNAANYVEWDRATVHYNDYLLWGKEGNEVAPEPVPTEPKLQLKMFNVNREEITNTIFIRYELENTGQLPVDLKDVKMQYFYTADGEKPQNYFVDWSTIGASNIIGEFIKLEESLVGADGILQTGFKETAGILQPGEKLEIHSRIGKSDWSNYNQLNDYSFNPNASNYELWQRVILLLNNVPIWGEESDVLPPSEGPQEPLSPIRIQMYNGNRSEPNNTIFPWFRIYNDSTKTIALKDVNIRYFFTIDGDKQLNYFVDWANIGASNVMGRFSQFAKPRPDGDHYFEISFKDNAGTLAPGEYAEVHTRVAKTDWSNFSQVNDFSFNAIDSFFNDWTKVNGYYKGYFVWGEADFFDIPQNLYSEATETTVLLQWEPVETAALYDVEVDGVVHSVDSQTSYLHTGLLAGTVHTYRVRAKTTNVTGGWSEPLEVFTVPGIPQSIQAISTSQSVSLSWQPVPGALSYEVEIYGLPIDAGASTAYLHTELNPNTQTTYRVRAKNDSGIGQWSPIVAQSTLPAVPTGLKANASSSSAMITWNSTAGATAYDLEVNGEILEGLTQPSFQHMNLFPNEIQSYRVRAKNPLGLSQWSSIVTVQTLPATPKNLVGAAEKTQILLSWASVEGATAYDLEVDGAVMENITATEYLHKNLTPDLKHTYRVRARNGIVLGEWSGAISVITLLEGELRITANPYSTQISVSWNALPGATSYDIEVNGVIISNGLSTSYIHRNLLPNTTHTYRVRARSQGGLGQWSAAVSATTIFGTPQNLQAIAYSDSITVFWQAVAGATGYDVFVDGRVISIGDNTHYYHMALEPYSWHVYRVRARGEGIVGEWSSAISKATLLGTPANIKATPSSHRIKLEWDSVANASYYEIEADGVIIKEAITSTFTHEGLELNKAYTYRIRAVRDGEIPEWNSISEWSASIKVTTLAGPPTNLKAEAATDAITLTWDEIEGVTRYDIEVDGTLVEVITTSRYVVEGLKPNTYHNFKVRARYGEELSEWSQLLEKNTLPELTIQVPKDNLFHFVVVAPPKQDKDSFLITVTYDSEAVEATDLSANAPQVILTTGMIPGTQINIVEFTLGKIVYQVEGATKTTVNSIQFLSLSNEDSKISYKIE